MNQTTQSADSSSETSQSPDRKSAWRKMWDLIRPWTTAFSVTLSVLSALYITAATGGSTSRALERLADAKVLVDQTMVGITDRLSHLEATKDDIGRIFIKLDAMSDTMASRSSTLASLGEKIAAQTEQSKRVWDRLDRIELKIDQIK